MAADTEEASFDERHEVGCLDEPEPTACAGVAGQER